MAALDSYGPQMLPIHHFLAEYELFKREVSSLADQFMSSSLVSQFSLLMLGTLVCSFSHYIAYSAP